MLTSRNVTLTNYGPFCGTKPTPCSESQSSESGDLLIRRRLQTRICMQDWVVTTVLNNNNNWQKMKLKQYTVSIFFCYNTPSHLGKVLIEVANFSDLRHRHFRLFWYHIPTSEHMTFIQCRINIDATAWRCKDVNATLYKRWVVISWILDGVYSLRFKSK